MALGSGNGAWNVDAVREAIGDARPAAEASRNLRLRATRGSIARISDAVRSLRGAGRVITGEVKRGVPVANTDLMKDTDESRR